MSIPENIVAESPEVTTQAPVGAGGTCPEIEAATPSPSKSKKNKPEVDAVTWRPTQHLPFQQLVCEQDRTKPQTEHERQARAEEIDNFARNLLSVGLQQPLGVAHDPARDTFHVLFGRRRYAAIARARQIADQEMPPRAVFDLVPCQVADQVLSAGMKNLVALVENLHRKDFTQVEKAKKFNLAQQTLGLSQNELAKRVGLSKGALSEILAVLALPAREVRRIERGEVSAKAAVRAWKQAQKAPKDTPSTTEEPVLVTQAASGGKPTSQAHACRWEDPETGLVVTATGAAGDPVPSEVVIAALYRWLQVLEAQRR